jgi:hypothetical protein
MPDTTTPEPELPFDPEVPKRVAEWLSLVWPGDKISQQALADLKQLLKRDAYARDENVLLAEKCAAWRGKYEEQHARADQAEARVAELTADREQLYTNVTIFKEQRDGAWSSVRAGVKVISGVAALALLRTPGDTDWELVAYQSRHLLRAAGPDLHLHFVTDAGGACGAEPKEGLPFRATNDENAPEIDCAACRAYIAGLKAGRNSV